jgi:hypothetical protein
VPEPSAGILGHLPEPIGGCVKTVNARAAACQRFRRDSGPSPWLTMRARVEKDEFGESGTFPKSREVARVGQPAYCCATDVETVLVSVSMVKNDFAPLTMMMFRFTAAPLS